MVAVGGEEKAPELVEGPIWSRPGLDVAAGRYPLSVERHVMRMVDHLVPGVTAVTPHARYYALHGLIATQADAEGLAVPVAQSLLRRAEVALAAVSFAHHPQALEWLPRAHGVDALTRRLRAGTITMSEAEVPGNASAATILTGRGWRRFALGLPLPTGTGTPFQDLLPVSWDERFTDDIEASLDEDDAEAVAAEHAPEAAGTEAGTATLPDLRQADQKSAADTAAG